MKKLVIASTLSFLLFAGCASNTALSQKEIMQQFPTVNQARTLLEKANTENIAYFAPKRMQIAKNVYDDALKQAKAGSTSANAAAEKAINEVNAAMKQSERAKYVLEDVLVARNKAVNINANALVPEKYEDAEKQLNKMLVLLEAGEDERAKRDINALKNQYLEIELAALKVNMLSVAQSTIKSALKADLDDVAPITVSQAQNEYKLALDILEVNRTDTAKANVHSNQAIWLIKRAEAIADVNQYFKNADFTEEQKILWYQDQLATVFAPLNDALPFEKSNKELINLTRQSLGQQLDENKDLSMKVSDLKQQLTALQTDSQNRESQLVQDKDQALMTAQLELEKEQKAKKEDTARFNSIQSMFTENEANVYRQVDNVLIRAQGFAFKPGSSEIESSNFALLNKIIDAVKKFPAANIVISGHTDITGSADLNLKLSKERAKTVASFMVQVGNIDESRVKSNGYGKEKPVASNDSVEGRAQNRRVEILIIN